MKRISLIFVVLLLLTNCSQSPTQNIESITNTKASFFNEFIKHLKLLTLPITLSSNVNLRNKLLKLNSNSIDTLFITKEISNSSYIFGILPDTTDNFKILYLSTDADIDIPCIAVFSKSGDLIFSKDLYVQDCGESGIVCGYECNMNVSINLDNTILSFDTTFSSLCDSITDEEIPNTTDTIIATRKGFINRKGSIEFSKILKKETKN